MHDETGQTDDVQKEEDGIARRTRSKLPLTTTSLYDIEEAFVAPDITADMYDTMCDDSDWQDFLMSLHKSGGSHWLLCPYIQMTTHFWSPYKTLQKRLVEGCRWEGMGTLKVPFSRSGKFGRIACL